MTALRFILQILKALCQRIAAFLKALFQEKDDDCDDSAGGYR